ncbi:MULTISPECIES: SRPBCC family protein [Nostocaceae]|uniref:CDP-paratose 2-epimerase n=3 Tax=Nostocaceae TaxID=1162 RepID=A0A8J6ZYW4_DESMC|nr:MULTISPECIES: hypothetical protein [Nostocaceae]MBD2565334.1 hypothetical protein [Nostoc linckia FACHB-391]MBD2651006.1 hypothetical protein [Nostoc foliaceum FACHB-393]MCF2151838.1 hypothetical protein [Desmonostoc muscorum LEGE 12446]
MKYKKTIKIDAPVEKVFSFCASPYGFEKHFPHRVRWINKHEEWNIGSIIEFKFRFFLVWMYWKTEITVYEENKFFADIMKVGFPYKCFNHYHFFEPVGNQTIYTDQIEFSLGFGNLIDRTVGKMIIGSIFTKRHKNLKKCLCKY